MKPFTKKTFGGADDEVNLTAYAAVDTVKKIILEKRWELTETYDKHIELTRSRNVFHYPVFIRWITALNSLYLEVRPKLYKQGYNTKFADLINLMDSSLKGEKNLIEPEAIKCTLHLIDFCEEMGITDIMFDKKDPGKAVLY